MNRISRHQCFMQMAEVVSRRSTCYRRNVGAVLTAHHRVVSIGYNGAPAGQPHCSGDGCAGPSGCSRAIHAEENALKYSGLVPGSTSLLTLRLYVTESPCVHCARRILDTAIEEVYYLHQYRLTEGLDLLVNAGVKVHRMTPSGYLIDFQTGQLIHEE